MNRKEIEEKVRQGFFPPSALKIAREAEEREFEFWDRWEVRKDSNRCADDQ